MALAVDLNRFRISPSRSVMVGSDRLLF